MKGQRIRYQQTGEFHFLTFSCFRRRPYLSTVAAMELFEDALERVRLRYLFAVAGYVVMPEHVHLLVNEPARGLLSRTVQALKLSVSMRRHYQTGMHGTVEIESEWTACERGWQLPEWMRNRQLDSPSPVPKGEGPGAPST
jgi:REP element-mobilizing transposase RayT